MPFGIFWYSASISAGSFIPFSRTAPFGSSGIVSPASWCCEQWWLSVLRLERLQKQACRPRGETTHLEQDRVLVGLEQRPSRGLVLGGGVAAAEEVRAQLDEELGPAGRGDRVRCVGREEVLAG